MDSDKVKIYVPGAIYDWLDFFDIILTSSGMSDAEIEWRVQLRDKASWVRRGRGKAAAIEISRGSAQEMLSEFDERAYSQRDCFRGDPQIPASVLFAYVKRERARFGLKPSGYVIH